MSRPIPDREAAILLLSQVSDFKELAPEETARIRELFNLDDTRSIEQRVREGSL